MGTPNPKKPSTPKLTPEQAAELNRRQAARRQADKRERDRQQAADEAAMLAEAVAQAKAEEEARVQHLADVERRLVEAKAALSVTEARLDAAVLMLACHHDMRHLDRIGVAETVMSQTKHVYDCIGRHYIKVANRSWPIPTSEALSRSLWLRDAVAARLAAFPSYDDPILTTSGVTPVDTPVTRTVRNSDRPEGIADRLHEAAPVSDEEQSWIDQQSRDPYDPYQAEVERIEAIAEGLIEDDDDDGERS